MLLLLAWLASAGGGLAAGLLMAGGYQLLLVWGLVLVFVQKYRRMDRSLFTGLKRKRG